MENCGDKQNRSESSVELGTWEEQDFSGGGASVSEGINKRAFAKTLKQGKQDLDPEKTSCIQSQ